ARSRTARVGRTALPRRHHRARGAVSQVRRERMGLGTREEDLEHEERVQATDSRSLTVRTDPLGGSSLARAAIANELPESWMPRRPAGRDAWQREVDRVRSAFAGRSWADALNDAIAATGEAQANLRRVVEGGGVLVTTGQQPGLFGGPVYTWSKALS